MDPKKNRPIIMLTLIGLIVGIPGQCLGWPGYGEKLDFTINLEKQTFLVLEPIWLSVYATNTGDDEARILPLALTCLSCLDIILVNSKGDTLLYSGTVHDVTAPPTGYPTKPGETRSNYMNLLEGFGEKIDGFGLRRFLEPETYSIQAVYAGVLKSNELQFKVSTPEGRDSRAYSIIREAYDYHIQFKTSEFCQKLETLVADYPGAVYGDLAYYEMTYWAPDPKEAQKYGRELILNYPNSRFTRFAFWKILRGKTRDEQIGFLDDILGEIPPGTRAAQWAQGSLEALKEE